MKWKGDLDTEEKHRHDYRWCKTLKERIEWIFKHYELSDKEYQQYQKLLEENKRNAK